MNLLEDIMVIDFSQFLSGPSACLRLADMGAKVIKIEKPGTGDICRELYVSDVMIEGESTIFHAINRNKQSYAADLKKEDDLEKVKKIIAQADVLMHNFRPGVMLPFDGQKNWNSFYKLVTKIFRLFTPKNILTMHEVGAAMIHCVTRGYSKNVLEIGDIKQLANS